MQDEKAPYVLLILLIRSELQTPICVAALIYKAARGKREQREGTRAFGSSILKGSRLNQGAAAGRLPYFKLSFLSPAHLRFLLFRLL